MGGVAGLTELEIVNGYQMVGLAGGTLIPSGLGWNYYSYAYAGSPFPEGVPLYLGVRFNGPAWQYGWIGVERIDGNKLDAFAWGYETEPGVPIAAGAPEPGSLALLAFGAGALASRRRKGKRQR